MRLRDILWLSYKDLGEKKVRTALTVLMVVIGVATIIALISQTAGMSESINSSLASLGPTSILLTSMSSTGFTIADTAAIANLQNVSEVIPILTGSGTLVINKTNTTVTVIGVSQSNLAKLLGAVNLYDGSNYTDGLTPQSLIGYSVAFPSSSAGKQKVYTGESATLEVTSGRSTTSTPISITGILEEYGTSLVSVDGAVVMPLTAAETLLHKTTFNTILVKATNTSTVTALSTLLTEIYGSNARITNTQQITKTASSITGSIALLLVVIAAISLIVAAIGIMNVMLMSVMERVHEIGILKALGFQSEHILLMFLLQSLIIGVMGGILGIGAGAGASFSLSYAVNVMTTNTVTNSTSTAASSSASAVAGAPTGFANVSNATSGSTSFGMLFIGSSSSSASSGASFASSSSSGGMPSMGSGSFPSGGPSGTMSGGPTSSSSRTTKSILSYTPVLTLSTILDALIVAIGVSMAAGIYPAWRASRMEPIDALRQL